jgi:hypothetical protein
MQLHTRVVYPFHSPQRGTTGYRQRESCALRERPASDSSRKSRCHQPRRFVDSTKTCRPLVDKTNAFLAFLARSRHVSFRAPVISSDSLWDPLHKSHIIAEHKLFIENIPGRDGRDPANYIC